MTANDVLIARSKNLAYDVTSIARCEDEPIAFCGAIQPSGLLFVVSRQDMTIKAVSRNWSVIAREQEAESLLGKSVHDYLKIDGHEKYAPEEICELLANEKLFVKIPHIGHQFAVTGSCHTDGPHMLLEFELLATSSAAYPVSPLKDLVNQVKAAASIEEVCDVATTMTKKLSGFDRVMIYRFDKSWNGEVISESLNEGLDPFLHLKYPASDIPAQARELFFQNKSRMIVNVEDEAVPIVSTGIRPGQIDLSQVMLRAVSPIHLQYLSNMGVRASFSAPIRVSDKLWGLISCHHYAGPMHPDREIRSAFELCAQIISGKISDLVARRRLQIKNETLLFTQKLLSSIAAGQDPGKSMTNAADELLALTDSSGAYLRMGANEYYIGQAPSKETVQGLLKRLSTFETLNVWSTRSISKDLKLSPDPRAAGVLAVPLSVAFEDTLIWFRREEELEVKWGGKPVDKESSHQGTVERLTPRASFAEWREKLQHHSRTWSDADEECAQYFLFAFVQGIFSKAQALSLAYQELELAAKAKDEFISMVSHELRTPLGIIIGWVDILRDYPQSAPEAEEAINIIDRNAHLQITLINDLLDISRIIAGKLRIDPRPNLDLNELVSDVLDGLKPTATAKNIEMSWRPSATVHMTADKDRLRQVIWNLVNNAVKFTPKGGRVTVQVENQDSSCIISVEDSGIGIDPAKLTMIFERFAQAKTTSANLGGLGLGLSIVKALVELHGGRVQAHSQGEGFGSKFTVKLPIYALKQVESLDELPKVQPKTSTRFQGLRILIAEDQIDSMRALKILIERNGAAATAVSNGVDALEKLKSETFDLILSDVGMPDMDGHTLLREWRAEEKRRGLVPTPAIALTAYASSKDRTQALEAGFQSHIPKPVDRDELFAVIESLRIVPD